MGGNILQSSYERDNLNKNKNQTNYVKPYPVNYRDPYKSNIINTARSKLNNRINNLTNESLEPNSKIVNNIYRTINSKVEQEKNKVINEMVLNDIKKTYNNNIESMNNIDDDSNFSDNYTHKMNNLIYNQQHRNQNINQGYYSDSEDEYSNNGLEIIDRQNEIFNDIISYNNSSDNSSNNSLDNQFGELKFNHKGIPNTIQQDKQVLNIFNNGMNFVEQSNFDPKGDGRYGVTKDMTHNNMMPSFKSKTYGYNPMFEEEMGNYSTRKIELFSGSDKNPQFKHKQEVERLFPMETNKVESVVGVPNFNDYNQSRYIPSDKRQSEKPFQPVRVSPGLNLGYNQAGNTGRQDMYRALPKTVDQLRTINNPKISYTPPVIEGQRGERRGVIGDMIQKTPDRFYYISPDSYLPQIGDYVAPAMYGKIILDQTNRSIKPDNTHLNPAQGIDKSTPEYLQGQFKQSFKQVVESAGPLGPSQTNKGQIINQESWTPNETNRQTVNAGDKYNGNMAGNKQQGILENFDNAIPTTTLRELNNSTDPTNVQGNHTQVKLINFLNYIPQATKRQIITEDNGRKNITNISGQVKSYLFNALNSIPDTTLRETIENNLNITNMNGNKNSNPLFNYTNGITDTNNRNLTEDKVIISNVSNHVKSYLYNNLNNIPDAGLREIVNVWLVQGGQNTTGNYKQNQLFNYNNAIPETTLRELTENVIHITNQQGNTNGSKQYLINYINSMPDTTLRELTENNILLTGVKGNEVKGLLYNYINSIPDTTLREMTENTKNIGNQIGNYKQNQLFNYENGITDPTNRNMSENTKNIIGQKGSQFKEIMFNYKNGVSDPTNRNMTENTKNIIGQKGPQFKEIMFNYENGITDPTNRSMTENTKNIIGQKGDGMQLRSRLDANNALLNTVKEIIAEGRAPVPCGMDKGKTVKFTEYRFNNDNSSSIPVLSSYKIKTTIENDLYSFKN